VTQKAAIVVGASGGIGDAVWRALLDEPAITRVHAVSRSASPADAPPGLIWHQCDGSEDARAATVATIGEDLSEQDLSLHRVVICIGTLHGDDYRPERALAELSPAVMQEVYRVNAVLPMLWLASLAPLFKGSQCVAAAFSARVGSIADNRLGGWYSYRASKAALNMMLQSAAAELGRSARGVKLLAFHPGTTDTALSRPFQARVPEGKLFTVEYVAARLLAVMDAARPDGTLSFVDYAGATIDW
jgi:NAD(P)-dependent dehydrogenase (short-subunit alcohol dehydrogenase family)